MYSHIDPGFIDEQKEGPLHAVVEFYPFLFSPTLGAGPRFFYGRTFVSFFSFSLDFPRNWISSFYFYGTAALYMGFYWLIFLFFFFFHKIRVAEG